MLDWNEYVSQLITQSSSLDGISLSLGDLSKPVGIPPIIKASIFMLDRMQEKQGKFNILVFPERIQSIFIFTLAKLLYNISEGKIDQAYDPSAFHPGDKLRFGSAVVEFVAIEEKDGNKRMKIRLAEDLTISASASYLEYNTVSTYLEYRVYKNKEIGFQVSEDTEYTVFADGLDPEAPLKFKLTLDGKEFTQEQWNSLGDIKVTLVSEEKFTMGEFKVEKTSDIGIIKVTPTLEGQEIVLDDYENVEIKIYINDVKENEVWSGSYTHEVKINEGRSWFERFGIYVIICLLVLLLIALIVLLIYWWRTHKVFPDTVELCEYLPAAQHWANNFIAVRIDDMICFTNSVGIIILTATGIKSCPNYKRATPSANFKISGVSKGAAVATGLRIDGELVNSADQTFTLGDETIIKYYNANGAEVKFKIRINRI